MTDDSKKSGEVEVSGLRDNSDLSVSGDDGGGGQGQSKELSCGVHLEGVVD